ncbi:hypothetical protein E2C01_064898 [Portunus trituberculatus]|uniref:Uncharacterized protein n=1 Tax=Portunus trituberculatus TaxID=210409 RepID=A0A5B7HKF3_PORTR|nr:hypothetical protein [Portunus trituberculatus]
MDRDVSNIPGSHIFLLRKPPMGQSLGTARCCLGGDVRGKVTDKVKSSLLAFCLRISERPTSSQHSLPNLLRHQETFVVLLAY